MSLKTRALVAIVLMVGFYALSITVAVLLLWMPYQIWANLKNFPIKLTAACFLTASVILWSILPRRDRFRVPGPRVSEAEQPRLFAEIRAIAEALAQQMPAEVYLIPEVNAWVAQRGGIMAIGSRRVMALGVPLMGLLTVSQFRAVLAHEFGHYHAGDTRLGPWVYKTRMALARTLESLAQQGSLMLFLFNGYARIFLHVTLAISRAQEYAADRMAAQLAGSTALIGGLKQIHLGTIAWRSYMEREVVPVLSEGFSPPLSQGFVHFLGAVNEAAQFSLAKELARGKGHRFDTHPALTERVAAIEKLQSVEEEDLRPAISLLENAQAVDCDLFLTNPGHGLRVLSWEEVVSEVWLRKWSAEVDRQSEALAGMKASDLADQLAEGHLWRRSKPPDGLWQTDGERAKSAVGIAAFALCLALMRQGWGLHALPGEMYLEKNGARLEPFTLTQKLASGEIGAEEWRRRCAETGIADLRLAGGLSKAASA